jgi:carbon monoxide dehydrogenase subunit G
MKVTGTSTLTADRATVWQALNDPAILVRTIPGCQRLESVGEDAYAMTVSAGVGSIKGVYDGRVRLTEQQEPGSFRMRAEGSGAPGTIGADVRVTLEDAADGGTALTYDADAVVGGMIGGVGQRMLTGVSKKMAAEFFRNVDAALAGQAVEALDGRAAGIGAAVDGPGGGREAPDGSGAPAPTTSAASSAGPVGTVFTSPQKPAAEGPAFVRGVVAGAAAALAGALVGAWISRRAGRA